jgi:hypothetical protein
MTGTSVDEDGMAAERSLAEQLMDLPDTAPSGAGRVVNTAPSHQKAQGGSE